MANTHKGKSLSFLYFLFILLAIYINSSSSEPIELDHPEHETETIVKSNSQDVLLHKLEELVSNLSKIVARLETKLSESTKVVASLDESIHNQEQDRVNLDSKRTVVKVQEERVDGVVGDGEKIKAISVTKYSPFWSERFQFVSAVKLDSVATCVNVLPFKDFEGFSKYVIVGDDSGIVYLFSRNGDVLIELDTGCDSSITAMVSYLSVYKNESVVVTGHENGVVLVHKVYEELNGEEWGTLRMETVGKFTPSSPEDSLPLTILEVHHVGRSRYILSSDASGMIRVLRENGTVHGTVVLTSRPVAFLKQRLLFLTESGAGSLDLRSMKVKESECEGLNHSLVRNYVFDATERSKAYGITAEGDLIHVLLLGDIMNFKCRVRSKRKSDMDEPLALQSIKGYLLAVNAEKVYAYNVSTQHYVRVVGPRLLFSAGLDEMRGSFLNYQAMNVLTKGKSVVPLISSDREKLVVLGLGGGYVGIYRSNLPVFKGDFNTVLWTSPVLIFLLFLFGAWQFFAKKKDTTWGPDDPFSSTSTTTGAPLVSSSAERPFDPSSRRDDISSSRRDDIMDLRAGGNLRGPTRRYASPSRYAGGGASGSFRTSTADTNSRSTAVDPNYRPPQELNSRPTSVDPNYRAPSELNARPTSIDSNYRPPSELKYRGSIKEPPGFPKRRENLFVNNQAVDDSS